MFWIEATDNEDRVPRHCHNSRISANCGSIWRPFIINFLMTHINCLLFVIIEENRYVADGLVRISDGK